MTLEEAQNWIDDVVRALEAANVIGMRSCRPGDGLNYASHDKFIREKPDLRAVLADEREQ